MNRAKTTRGTAGLSLSIWGRLQLRQEFRHQVEVAHPPLKGAAASLPSLAQRPRRQRIGTVTLAIGKVSANARAAWRRGFCKCKKAIRGLRRVSSGHLRWNCVESHYAKRFAQGKRGCDLVALCGNGLGPVARGKGLGFGGVKQAPSRRNSGAHAFARRVRLQLPLPENFPRLPHFRGGCATVEKRHRHLSSNTPGGLPVPGRQRVEPPLDGCGDANFWKEIALRDLDGRLGRVGLMQRRQNGGVRAQRNGCRRFQSGQRNMIERGGRDERHRLGTSQLPIDCRAFGKPCSGDGALDGRVGNAHAAWPMSAIVVSPKSWRACTGRSCSFVKVRLAR